jgi:hypothetical protein
MVALGALGVAVMDTNTILHAMDVYQCAAPHSAFVHGGSILQCYGRDEISIGFLGDVVERWTLKRFRKLLSIDGDS